MTMRYLGLTALYTATAIIFLAAAVATVPQPAPVTMSSATLEKTNRGNIGSPDSFVTDRFAG